MPPWPARPIIYEINTWVWLNELSRPSNGTVTLANVPDFAWDELSHLGIDAVWLMGIWERSPLGRAISLTDEGVLADFKRALPDFTPKDNVGSPYCIRRYSVDAHLGGPAGLAVARRCLEERGIRLILDFVPNHVAPDHPWTDNHPEYFISGRTEDVQKSPGLFMAVGNMIYARGRDPHYPAWPDVLQINVFHPDLRQAMIGTLKTIAAQCDGVRCDMAMLVMNDIFEETWKGWIGPPPPEDYWTEMIQAVRKDQPHFLFLAEAYWSREWDLQQQGFDLCYDKRLYDRLVHENADTLKLHLSAGNTYQERLLRFIENHDEPRAASVFSTAKEKAAAVTMATVPGAKLFHDGQLSGRKVRIPVFSARRPDEQVDADLAAFYRRLFEIINMPCLRSGSWQLCESRGWPDNRSFENLMAWRSQYSEEVCLVVVNYADIPSQGLIQLAGLDLPGDSWQMTDLFTGAVYERSVPEITRSGLFVGLPPWGFHVFQTAS
ncbi:MAG: alpha-amylase family glycosyl hydrolase [Syntrophales bacterium]|nr:alpha-amylase family glycosyl hydrolase [Syntrophales bacterium]